MDSNKPVVVQKRSLKMVMEPGIYFWCACGRSANQPFCDGSHRGTSFKPQKVVVEEKQLVKWCACVAIALKVHYATTNTANWISLPQKWIVRNTL